MQNIMCIGVDLVHSRSPPELGELRALLKGMMPHRQDADDGHLEISYLWQSCSACLNIC